MAARLRPALNMLLGREREITTNEAMVQDLQDAGVLQSPELLRAFRTIDRGAFWVQDTGPLAYADMPLRYGRLHQSAPHIYGRVMEALMPLSQGMSFLNIGSGTGYLSCVMSEIIGDTAVNEGVEVWPDTVEHARSRCAELGKTNIEFTCGNVYNLDVDKSMRYDRIYVGACANSKSKYLYDLLEVGGVLVGPFQFGYTQQLRRVVRQTETHFAVEVLNSVQFATLVEPPPSMSLYSANASRAGLCGLPGVPFTFTLSDCVWTPEKGRWFPDSFKRIVKCVSTGLPSDGGKLSLPPEVWIDLILPWCSRRWFEEDRAPIVVPAPATGLAASLRCLARNTLKQALRIGGNQRSLTDRVDGAVSSSGGSSSSSEPPTALAHESLSQSSDEEVVRSASTTCMSSGQEEPFGSAGFVEAFEDGVQHILGVGSDPDDFVGNSRNFLMGWWLQGTRTNVSVLAEATPTNGEVGVRPEAARVAPIVGANNLDGIWPLRGLRRCLGRCLAARRSTRRLAQEHLQEQRPRSVLSQGVSGFFRRWFRNFRSQVS
eukprot:TRINITY_DN45901_c0_g1_i1.p1 TRINITY_DN45901_c0_g1~~TRINITY_DN45901_c0_g1_i1.p1  ORF type:complete len:544 (-),score=85.65 TRINITY_DN45901_c0_g1_i1:182-1813(-)